MGKGCTDRVTVPPANTAVILHGELEDLFAVDGIDQREQAILDISLLLMHQTDLADESFAIGLAAMRGSGPRGTRFRRLVGEADRRGLRLICGVEEDEDPEPPAALAAAA